MTAHKLQYEAFRGARYEKMMFAVAEICLNPFNRKSYEFNTNVMNWGKIGERISQNKDTWGIFKHDLSEE